MQETGSRALVAKIVDATPGTHIAIIGLSLSLYASESTRMSSFQDAQPGSLASAFPGIVAIAILIAFLLVYHAKPTFRLHRHMTVGFVIAGALAGSALLATSVTTVPPPDELVFLSRCVRRTCELLLMLCWAEVLLPLGARPLAVVLALSLLALSGVNALSALLKEGGAYTMLALVPFLSVACLYWFKDRLQMIDHYQPDRGIEACGPSGIDQSLMTDSPSRASTALIFLLPLACYSFVFGNVHFSWVPNQDRAITSLSIQLAAAFGTMLSSLLILALVTHFWGRRKLELYNPLLLPLLVLTLYLTDLLGGSLSFLYVAPLNIVQKLALFLMWIVPFLIPHKRSPLIAWGIALILYQTGKVLSTALSGTSNAQLYTLAAIGFITVLIAGNIVGIILDHSRQKYAPNGSTHSDPHEMAQKTTRKGIASQVCGDIAKEYRLTRREEEILVLLSEGMTAAAIAEALVVSTSTAKSHMRNIYAKLDVHTQSELLLLIHHYES
ncbi:helix-turn-helix transcriptional regulator [Gordonibacter sp. An230]|uniref:helix-turn-helix transcriptional regulator n=1 Tax=Gordonibacter sp. An230 TaxID=1965592 RepID=UPI0013A611B9|nr:helix-turn-helix transcriptional regulator [Gordonibacter sp. An230]